MHDRFAKQLITHLATQGVRRVCLSPGSRSSPLAIAAAKEPRLEKMVHFDERAMAFHAYGYAKASKTPVALITTSGSAVGHLFPAVMEAYHDRVPLILLTADRPTELQDCMSNQTCDQVKFFGAYVKWMVEIPAADGCLPDRWLATTMAHAVFRATHSPPGPVHLNCQFREPFFSTETFPIQPTTCYAASHMTISNKTAETFADQLSSFKRGVIIAASIPSSQGSIADLAEKLGWPLIADVMSGLRSSAIPYAIDLLKSHLALKADCILLLGDRLVSKQLLTWIAASNPSSYIVVADHPFRSDVLHQVTDRVVMDPSLFCERVLPFISPVSEWAKEWKTLSTPLEYRLDEVIPPMSEPGLIRYLHHHLPSHYAVYFSNSMPVRDADRFFFPSKHQGPIFGQRGLSGIDGNLATAIGLAEGAGRPLVAVIGDLAALHDINALAQLRSSKQPVVLLIINNGGGGIFSFLPVAEQTDIFEEYIATAHSWNFSKAAELFQVPYLHLTNMADLQQVLDKETTTLIEFSSCRKENLRIHQQIENHLSLALLSG